MLINTKKCIGCYACRTACQRQNDLLPDESFIRFEEREVGKYPNVTVEHIPLQCMHCEDALALPRGAATWPDGIVGWITAGHRLSVLHGRCPYQVRTRNSRPKWLCTLSSYENGTKMCSCVDACLTGARIFGDLDDSDSEISKEIARTGAAPIAGDLTRAKIYYVR
ncbi:MAG: 4Fe-4S ferredoxin [Eggerthella lenta]